MKALFAYLPGDSINALSESKAAWNARAETGKVDLRLSNMAGSSNAFSFTCEIAPPCGNDPVKFAQSNIHRAPPDDVTAIAMGPDFRYYMATSKAKIIVVGLGHDDGRKATSQCEAESFKDPKWFHWETNQPASRISLGIAFNPKCAGVKVFATTSAIYWGPEEDTGHDILRDDLAWASGNIEAFAPGDGCMKREDFLIAGIPVSSHDQSINSKAFDNDGDLRFQVGGFTNQGVPGQRLGNVDENPLPAAITVALISKGSSFDGKLTYDKTDPALAKQISGDAEVYAAGFRSSFGLTLRSNGKLYATDNGPNGGFGRRSVACNADLSDKGHGGKIMQMKKGKRYGSPNRNRGECVFIDDTGKAPTGDEPPAALKFDPLIAKAQSSTNGIIERMANAFQGKSREGLFSGKFAGGKGNGNA